MLKIMLA